MTKQYRVNAFVRINNATISSLVRLGIRVGGFSLLTVRGRKSGKPIVTPLVIFVQDQKRYLIAAYGIVNWVRNLRAAGGEATLTWGGTAKRFVPSNWSQPPQPSSFGKHCAPVPQALLPWYSFFRVYRALFVLPYLNVTENSSLEEFEREVLTHPVFLVQSASEQAGEQGGRASL